MNLEFILCASLGGTNGVTILTIPRLEYPLFQKACLGRVLGPAKNEGNETTQWILNDNGNIIPRRTVKKLAYNNLPPRNEVEKGNRDAFYNKINIYLVNLLTLLQQHRTPNNYQKMTMK